MIRESSRFIACLLVVGILAPVNSLGTTFFVPQSALAKQAEPEIAGIVTGTGTRFEITQSDYLNLVVDSVETIELSMQSVPQIVTMQIAPVSLVSSTWITLSGFKPLTTYYKYEDNYHNLVTFTTDDQGAYSYTQDLSETHFVIIQTAKSTKFITDNATGGDCASIGTWDQAAKTCTLTDNLSEETIQIDSDHITLDGNGYRLSQSGTTSSGVYVPQRTGVTITNLTVSGFTFGIALINSTQTTVSGNTLIQSNGNGIHLQFNSTNNTLTGNTVQMQDAQGTGILLFGSNLNTVTSNVLTGGFAGLQSWYSLQNTFTNNTFGQNRSGIQLWHSSLTEIYSNDFLANQNEVSRRGGFGNVFNVAAPTGGNYWSSYATPEQGCSDLNSDGFCDASYIFSAGQDDLPWTTPFNDPVPEVSGFSSVAFIPGLQASRLYLQEQSSENKLWEPNWNTDVTKLFLDESGESLNPDIYTRDVIDEAFGYNIYKTFIAFMDDLVDQDVIASWQAIPYDWRFDVDVHLSDLIANIETLADGSDNGKVTIVTHSNGGLLAKALLIRLEHLKDDGTSDLIDDIDRVILVASPQLGTPKTVASLLHGYDLAYAKGLVLDNATARQLGEHMPSAFNLLPSRNYFDRVLDPVITFDESADQFAPFTALFGSSVDTFAELRQFLTGADNAWNKPASEDTVSPTVLLEHFLNTAEDNQADFSAWTPPEHIAVTQLAGWGLDTVRTFEYAAKKKRFCGNISATFCKDGHALEYRPVFTSDGDETVVVPSAVAMEEEKFYINLKDYNEELIFNLRRNRKHSDILEARPVQDLIKNLLANIDEIPEHITDVQPSSDVEDKRLRVSVHSPVSIRVCNQVLDESGRPICTGLASNVDPDSDVVQKEENIANSYYLEIGEGKYLGFGADELHTIELKGLALGTFTLEIEEVVADEVINTLNYEDILVSEGTVVELTLRTTEDASNLQIDIDGDGSFDYAVPAAGEDIPPTVLADMLSHLIGPSSLKHGAKQSSQAQLTNFIRHIKQGKKQPARAMLVNLERTIQRESGLTISEEEARVFSDIVERIIASI